MKVDKEEKLCECCGKRPVGVGRTKYCDDCAKHTVEIRQYKKQGKDLSQLKFLGNRICACCGKRLVGTTQRKYCNDCIKHRNTIIYAKFKKVDLKTLVFDNRNLCECCGKRPTNGYKYCEVCQEHYQEIHKAKIKGINLNALDLSKPKLCKCCGERPVAYHHAKYCNECSKSYYQIYRKLDFDLIDQDKPLKPCARCKTRERMIGKSYCQKCFNRHHWKYYHKRHQKSQNEASSKLCVRCHQHEKYKHNKYCYECVKYNARIYGYTGRNLDYFKPVPHPEAYYTKESTNLTCPICQAEFCLPNLPLGKHCKGRILHRYRSTTWREVLKLQGIRVPTLEKIAPELDHSYRFCMKCKTNPRKSGYLFCKDCLESMQKARTVNSSVQTI